MRSRIVLNAGQGLSKCGDCAELRVTGVTVIRWRERYRKFGMEGLLDEPQVRAPPDGLGSLLAPVERDYGSTD